MGVIWERYFSCGGRLILFDDRDLFVQAPNGYFFVATGYVQDAWHQRGVIFHISDTGDSLWSRSYSYDYHTSFASVLVDQDLSIVVAGATSPEENVEYPETHGFVAKFDLDGNEIWTWHSPIVYTKFESIVPCGDDYLAMGIYYNHNVLDSMFVHEVKISRGGQLVEENRRFIGHPSSSWMHAIQASNDKILVSLYTWRDGFSFYELDSALDTVWTFPVENWNLSDALELVDSSLVIVGRNPSGSYIARTEPNLILSTSLPIQAPSDIALHPAYPNPFNPNTTITFDLAREMNVTLTAYDILGNQVATLVNSSMSTGTHEVTFNATNLPSGIYFCRLEAGTFSQTQKLMLLK